MNAVDLRACLDSCPYDAEKNIRLGRGADGREIILVRQPMGLEQYEADGRPDGTRAQGMETLLDLHRARIHAAEPAPAAPSSSYPRGIASRFSMKPARSIIA